MIQPEEAQTFLTPLPVGASRRADFDNLGVERRLLVRDAGIEELETLGQIGEVGAIFKNAAAISKRRFHNHPFGR